jgi:hypothetical protein
MTIFQDCKKFRNSDPSEEDLKRFFQRRNAYYQESKKLGQNIFDYLELSPLSWPEKYQEDFNNEKNNRKNKESYPNLDL